MNIYERISDAVLREIKNEIKKSGGNEVFFKGIPDENGFIDKIEVIARGNSYSVPAIVSRLGKKDVIIHNHPSGILYPSDNDVRLSAMHCQSGGGSYIVNNDADDIYVVVEPNKPQKIDIGHYFKKDGELSKKFSGYEYRNEQYEMATAIEESLNGGSKIVIEAGTGTGKTLAYLIPLLEWGLSNNKKVVVSTNTINLQEQLMRKDIPTMRNIIGKEFKEVLVKGRGNYICIRKVNNIRDSDSEEFGIGQKKELESITKWCQKTNIGDKNELEFEPAYSVWEKVNSESDLCNRNKCIYKDKCFFFKARKEIIDADILVCNHHMYFADLAIRKESGFITDYGILPNYSAVVFDEAHNIEKVARDYFSFQVSKSYIMKLLNNIYNYKGEKKRSSGSASKAIDYVRETIKDREKVKKIEDYFSEEIYMKHKILYEKADDFFQKIISVYAFTDIKKEIKHRIRKEETEEKKEWTEEILKRKNEVKAAYVAYVRKLTEFIEMIEDLELDDEFGFINDLSKFAKRVSDFLNTFDFVFAFNNEEYVYWLEINSKRTNIEINATPLKIKDELNETLYSLLNNIIFTSATLAVGNNFEYFKKSIGIEEEIMEKIIKSPFNYQKQMKVFIPSNIKDPADKNFNDEANEIIEKIIRKTEGRAFVLFTSYSSLNYTYYKIRNGLESDGYTLLLQGEYQRHRILDIFKNIDKAVLFGADSFWEGVDVQGEKLSSVILVKLPFRVPSEPVVEAIIENIVKNGGNSFMEYQIPEAVIKFKQGIGRLIRSKEDKGIITVLDSRIVSKNYGRLFLDAIPGAKVVIKPKDELFGEGNILDF